MYLFPNKSGDMDLVIFMTPEVFFSEVINGKCPFILGFDFSFSNSILSFMGAHSK